MIDAGTAFDLSAMPKVHQEKVAWGTEDFTQGPAMTVEQAEKALKVGMKVADECIDKGYNLLVTAEMGIGNTTSTAAIVSAFLGLPPELTVGRGTGINDERMAIKERSSLMVWLKINHVWAMPWISSVRLAVMTMPGWRG